MSKNATYGVLAVIVLLGLLLVGAQHLFKSGSGMPAVPGTPPAPPARLPQITADKVQKEWSALIASAPPARGPANAQYQMIEIGDFQCPNCGRMKPLAEALLTQSRGKLKLYFVNWPLTRIHPYALGAAQAGDAAAAQGKFWPMYDLLYADQADLRPTLIQYDARSLAGLDADRLAAEMNSGKYLPAIKSQTKLVIATGAISTPTFLLRSPGNKYSWYVGSVGATGVKGLKDLAEAPPWGNPLSKTAVDAMTSDTDTPPLS